MTIKFKEFSSGVRLVAKQMKGIYSFSLGVLVKVGSRFEKLEENGFSHFIEHMSFKGTKNRTAFTISKEVDAMGGDINAYTSKDTTCYYTRAGNQYIEKCFDILSDMYFNSTFPQAEFDSEKNVILEEISIDEDTPDDICNDLVAQALFGERGYGLNVTGKPAIISKTTRQDLMKFKNKYYTAPNTVISIAGNFNFEQVCDLVEKYFNSLFTNKGEENHAEKSQFQNSFLHRFKEVEQSHIALAYPCLKIDKPNITAYSAIANILGGGMSSRLFQEIREKRGLAYSVYSFYSNYDDCGFFQIYCGTNPKTIKSSVEVLFEQLNLLANKGFTDEELTLAKSQMQGNTQLAQESTMAIMRAAGSYMLRKNKVFNINNNLKAFQNLDLDFVNQCAGQLLTSPFASSYVGKEIRDYDLVAKKMQS